MIAPTSPTVYNVGMSDPTPATSPSVAWVGWVLCAAVFMMLAGVLTVIEGLVALFNDDYYAEVGDAPVLFNLTTWGVIHVVLGVALVVVGYALFKGSRWAVPAAAGAIGLNIISHFLFAAANPAWALMAIAINGFTLWAVLVHGADTVEPH